MARVYREVGKGRKASILLGAIAGIRPKNPLWPDLAGLVFNSAVDPLPGWAHRIHCMSGRVLLILGLALFGFSYSSPAPLIYRAGFGWSYEPATRDGKPADGKWERKRAKDQLEVSLRAFEEENYDLCYKAARRVVKSWPLSDFAPTAQYYIGRSYEARGRDEKAFKEYQKLLEKYPKIENYQEVLKQQYDIATRYLNGKRFRLFGYIPLYRSMEKTVQMYEKIIKNGPYSDVAPGAQMNIGTANEKQDKFLGAVHAYEAAADRYHDRKDIAAEAMFKAGQTYYAQAKAAEYDQGVARKAIEAFTDFVSLHPEDKRVEEARKIIENLRTEQARGAIEIAKFYAKQKNWNGALVYYNEALVKAPNSIYANDAKKQIEAIKGKLNTTEK